MLPPPNTPPSPPGAALSAPTASRCACTGSPQQRLCILGLWAARPPSPRTVHSVAHHGWPNRPLVLLLQAAVGCSLRCQQRAAPQDRLSIARVHVAGLQLDRRQRAGLGLAAKPGTLPGPIKLKTKAGDVYARAMDDKYEAQRAVGVVAAYALAGSEENARGHLVVTAPTGGSAGVMPALVYVLGEGGRKLPQDKIRNGFLAAAADRLPVQAQRDAVGRRGRLPGGDRCRLGDGGGVHRRKRTTSRRRWSPTRRNRRWSITSA